jgi:archaellum biogenesis protein FlaJ (TadC family)
MTMVSAFGVYIIFRTAPYEVRTYQNRRGPKERRWAKRLFTILLPIGVLLGAVAGISMGFHFFSSFSGFASSPPESWPFWTMGK